MQTPLNELEARKDGTRRVKSLAQEAMQYQLYFAEDSCLTEQRGDDRDDRSDVVELNAPCPLKKP